jgi:S-adenosyl-L-methionine hydrolase (adenosine-forming)
MNVPIVALLTDFGTSDLYVGVMKGVILSRCPAAQCIDLTHEIAPQNVRQASYLLRTGYQYFPPHTVFLAVVDPGVGTNRRPLALHTAHGYFVGPDNGIFSGVLARASLIEAVALNMPSDTSQTFHGRDVFAPAAAALANGAAISTLGTPIGDVQREDWLRPTISESAVRGEMIHIDHFGNAITTIGACRWSGDGQLVIEAGERGVLTLEPSGCEVWIGEKRITQVVRTYGLTQAGAALALISSDGQLEIAVNGGNAAQQLQIQIGDAVELRYHR